MGVGKGSTDEFTLEVSNPDIVQLTGFANGEGRVTALKEGSTTILVKNQADGEIMKSHPILVSSATYSNIEATNPTHKRVNTRQLTHMHIYDIEVELLTNEGKKIYPSPNISSLAAEKYSFLKAPNFSTRSENIHFLRVNFIYPLLP